MAQNRTLTSYTVTDSLTRRAVDIFVSLKTSAGFNPSFRSIQQRLFWRLSIAGMVIAAVLSLLVYISEQKTVSRTVSSRAWEVVVRFNDQIKTLLDDPEIPKLEIIRDKIKVLFAASKIKHQQGQLIYLKMYDQFGDDMGLVMNNDYASISTIASYMQEHSGDQKAGGDNHVEIKYFGGAPHVILTVPLVDSSGKIVARIEEVVAVSYKVLTEIETRIFKTILMVFAIVFAVTLAFYPIYRSLLAQQLKLTQNLLESNIDILQVLGSAIAKRDSNTDSHNYRVTIYAVCLAEAIKLNHNTIQSLIKGAFLHDVGKIGISDTILLKPGKLNQEEFEVMKNHVQHGIDIVKRSEWLKDAADIVECHHEQYGGNGYPMGLKGRAIPVGARIFAIADVFDALTSRRPYKESFSYRSAVNLIREKSGIHFDPDFVDVFFSIIGPIHREIKKCNSRILRHRMSIIINKYFS